ncbi:sensor histidine kinase [Actinomadura craniellae]|uniref:histidine kinase n=1 Tax=Actinomadura craniellae TaxID=2231787 RepID=A0A365H5Q5_9ACTN|nr:histidine kinase [Actinomadura craniellae]RAY14368.1 sensor histidine kinase [Actinomadura craniellae]
MFVKVRLRGLALLGLAVVELGACALALAALLATYCVGVGWFVLGPAFGGCRRLAVLARRHAREWSGVEIPEPYTPGPPLPVRQPDGWYRHGRGLYRSPRLPAYNLRTLWMYSDGATWRDLLWTLLNPVVGGVLALLVVLFGAWPLRLHARWTRVLLAPTRRARLGRRVEELTRTRTEATDSLAAELRRIERDLHDGTQARLVALGMTVAAAEELVETDPVAARALLARARESAGRALTELRGIVRGIYPPVLAERGLADAVRALALDAPLDVTVTAELRERPAPPVESVVYFAVSEALGNVVRHSGAGRARVELRHAGGRLRVSVTDDGCGGATADSGGSGLRGIERRLAPFDGALQVSSPPGGPTTVTVELPGADEPEPEDVPMSKEELRVIAVLVLASMALWPQGVVPMAIQLTHDDSRSWFLALYLPEPLQWPTIAIMIAAGLYGYWRAGLFGRLRRWWRGRG